MFIRNVFYAFAAMAAAVLSPAFGQGTGTTTTFTRTYSFQPVGLASTESAQINVVNLASASSSGTAASCTGTISFVNNTGAIIGTATSFTVGTGQVSSASIPFSRVSASGGRVAIRGVVTQTGTAPSAAPCSLVYSFETFDTTSGVTHVELGNSASIQEGGPGGR